jgi:integrase
MTQTLTPTQTQALILSDPLPSDRHPAAVYLAGLAKGSQRAMRGALDTIAHLLIGNADARAVNWAALRFQHTSAIRSKLTEKYSAATANKMLSALRGVLKTAWRLGLMDAEDYTRAADVKSVSGSTLPAGRALTAGEIAALLEACASDTTQAGARDAALIALLRAGGLRRAEICALELDDYTPADGQLIIKGKRNKERTAYVTNGAADALADWLAVRGNEPGPLFCPVNKGGRVIVSQQRMFPEAIFNMLRKRGEQAGVKDLSPHDLRRTFVSDLLDAGADISTVQRLAGHASVNTTARYDRRGEEAKRKAVELLHVPYTRRRKTRTKPETKRGRKQKK